MELAVVSVVIATASIVVGVAFAILKMRDASRVRHTGLIIQLDPALRISLAELGEAGLTLNSRDCSDYAAYVDAHGDPLADKAFATMALYYEGLGFLLHRRLVDIDEIEYFVTGTAPGLWQKVQPLVVGVREQYGQPSLFRWFEYLADQTRQSEPQLG